MTTISEQPAVDWQFARELRERNGLSYKEIAKRIGVKEETIRQRAARGRWTVLSRAADAAVTRLIPTAREAKTLRQQVVDRAMAATSNALSEGVSRFITKSLAQSDSLMDRAHEAALAAQSARELRDAAAAWSIGHSAGRTARGLDQGPVMPDGWNPGGGSSPLIVVMQSTPEIGQSAPAGPVIDVTSPPDSQIT